MRFKKRLLSLLTAFLMIGMTSFAQQVYPVQLTGFTIPPYSLDLSVYTFERAQDLSFTATLNDPVEPFRDVRLNLSIETNQNVIYQTDPNFVSQNIRLNQFQAETFDGNALAPYLNPMSLTGGTGFGQGSVNIPEGRNAICLEVIDVERNVPISRKACVYGIFLLNQPPQLLLPACGDELEFPEPQNLLFNWTPMHIGSTNSPNPVEYEFTLVELMPGIADPNDGFESAFQIYQTTTMAPSLLYSVGEPPLEPNKTYAWRVRAYSLLHSTSMLFENEGYSQVCTFTFFEAGTGSGASSDDEEDSKPTPQGCEVFSTDFGPVNAAGAEPVPLVEGDIVSLGYFDMEVLDATPSGDGVSGTGFVTIPFLKTKLPVNFIDLKVKESMRAFGVGSLEAVVENDFYLDPSLMVPGNIQNIVTEDYATNLENFFAIGQGQSRLTSMFNPSDPVPVNLPIGIDKETNGEALPMIAVVGMRFTERNAYMNCIAYENLEGGDVMRYVGLNLEITPYGVKGNSNLDLLEGGSSPLSGIFELTIKAGNNGSSMAMDCSGYTAYDLKTEVQISKQVMVRASDKQAIRFQLGAATNDPNQYLGEIEKFEDFSIPSLPGFVFRMEAGQLDLNVDQKLELTENTGYQQANENNWQGLHLNEVQVTLPPEFDFTGNNQNLQLQQGDLFLSEAGAFGNFTGTGLISLEEGRMTDWPYSVDQFNLVIEEGSPKSSSISGKIQVPLLDEPFDYQAELEINGADLEIEASPEPGVYNMSMWNGTFEVEEGTMVNAQLVDLGSDGKEFFPSTEMNGKLSFDLKEKTFLDLLTGDKAEKVLRIRQAFNIVEDIDFELSDLPIEGLTVDPFATPENRYSFDDFGSAEGKDSIKIAGKAIQITALNLLNHPASDAVELGLELEFTEGLNELTLVLWASADGQGGFALDRIEANVRKVDCDCVINGEPLYDPAKLDDYLLKYYNKKYDSRQLNYEDFSIGGSHLSQDLNPKKLNELHQQLVMEQLRINNINGFVVDDINNPGEVNIPFLTGANFQVNNYQPVFSELLLNGGAKDYSKLTLESVDEHRMNFDGTLPFDLTQQIDDFLYDNETDFPANARLLITDFRLPVGWAQGQDFTIELTMIVRISDSEQVESVGDNQANVVNSSNYLVFVKDEVAIGPDRVAFSDLKLSLLEDIAHPDNNNLVFRRNDSEDPSEGSYVYLECEGFQHYNVQADFIVPYGDETSATNVIKMTNVGADAASLDAAMRLYYKDAVFPMTINGRDLVNFIAPLHSENRDGSDLVFQIHGLEFKYIRIETGHFDFHRDDNPEAYVGNYDLFKGLVFDEIEVEFAGIMTKEGGSRQTLKVTGNNFYYDIIGSEGLIGSIDMQADVIPKSKGADIGGWKYEVSKLIFGMFDDGNNNGDLVPKCGIEGSMLIPLFTDKDFNWISFVGDLSGYWFDNEETNQFYPLGSFHIGDQFDPNALTDASYELSFIDNMNMQLMGSTIDFIYNRNIGEFEAAATLNGKAGIFMSSDENDGGHSSSFNLGLPLLGFQGLVINGGESACGAEDGLGGIRTIDFGTWGLFSAPEEDEEDDGGMGINGFPFGIEALQFNCTSPGEWSLIVGIRVNLVGVSIKNLPNISRKQDNYVAAGGGASALTSKIKGAKTTRSIEGVSFDPKKKSLSLSTSSATGNKKTVTTTTITKNKKGMPKIKVAGLSAITQLDFQFSQNDNGDLEFRDVDLDALYIYGEFASVTLQGFLILMDNDALWGDGIKGYLDLTVEGGFSFQAKAMGQFGSTVKDNNISGDHEEEYRYFFLDLEFVSEKGIQLGAIPVSVHGASGGIFYNCDAIAPADAIPAFADQAALAAGQVSHPTAVSDTNLAVECPFGDLCAPGAGLSLYNYEPSKGRMGMHIGVILALSNRPQTLIAEVKVGAQLTTDFTFEQLDIQGNVYMQAEDIFTRDEAPLQGTVDVSVDFVNKELRGAFSVTMEYEEPPGLEPPAKPLYVVTADVACNFHFALPGHGTSEGKWYFKMGAPRPEDHQTVTMEVLDIFTAQVGFYLQFGHDIDPIPAIQDIVPRWPGTETAEGRLADAFFANGDGILFGMKFGINGEASYGPFYGKFEAGMGFDLSMMKYEDSQCEPYATDGFGIRNWYIRGNAYAYIDASMGLQYDIGFASGSAEIFSGYAAVAMRAEFPNPAYFQAQIYASYSILGGALKGSVNFRWETGERMDPSCLTTSVDLDGLPELSLPLIGDTYPSNDNYEDTDIPIFAKPQVAFNLPINQVIAFPTYNPETFQQEHTEYYKPIIKEDGVYLTNARGTRVESLVIQDANTVTLEPNDLLEANSRYELHIEYGWELKISDGEWNLIDREVENSDGSTTNYGNLEKTISFTTGDFPTEMIEDAFSTSQPANGQHFWTDDYAIPLIEFKHKGWDQLFPASAEEAGEEGEYIYDYTVQLTEYHKNGNGATGNVYTFPVSEYPGMVAYETEEIRTESFGVDTDGNGTNDVTLYFPIVEIEASNGKTVEFEGLKDAGLLDNKLYNLQILRVPITKTAEVMVTEEAVEEVGGEDYQVALTIPIANLESAPENYGDVKILYEMWFGTSSHDSFSEKVRSYFDNSVTISQELEDWDYSLNHPLEESSNRGGLDLGELNSSDISYTNPLDINDEIDGKVWKPESGQLFGRFSKSHFNPIILSPNVASSHESFDRYDLERLNLNFNQKSKLYSYRTTNNSVYENESIEDYLVNSVSRIEDLYDILITARDEVIERYIVELGHAQMTQAEQEALYDVWRDTDNDVPEGQLYDYSDIPAWALYCAEWLYNDGIDANFREAYDGYIPSDTYDNDLDQFIERYHSEYRRSLELICHIADNNINSTSSKLYKIKKGAVDDFKEYVDNQLGERLMDLQTDVYLLGAFLTIPEESSGWNTIEVKGGVGSFSIQDSNNPSVPTYDDQSVRIYLYRPGIIAKQAKAYAEIARTFGFNFEEILEIYTDELSYTDIEDVKPAFTNVLTSNLPNFYSYFDGNQSDHYYGPGQIIGKKHKLVLKFPDINSWNYRQELIPPTSYNWHTFTYDNIYRQGNDSSIDNQSTTSSTGNLGNETNSLSDIKLIRNANYIEPVEEDSEEEVDPDVVGYTESVYLEWDVHRASEYNLQSIWLEKDGQIWSYLDLENEEEDIYELDEESGTYQRTKVFYDSELNAPLFHYKISDTRTKADIFIERDDEIYKVTGAYIYRESSANNSSTVTDNSIVSDVTAPEREQLLRFPRNLEVNPLQLLVYSLGTGNSFDVEAISVYNSENKREVLWQNTGVNISDYMGVKTLYTHSGELITSASEDFTIQRSKDPNTNLVLFDMEPQAEYTVYVKTSAGKASFVTNGDYWINRGGASVYQFNETIADAVFLPLDGNAAVRLYGTNSTIDLTNNNGNSASAQNLGLPIRDITLETWIDVGSTNQTDKPIIGFLNNNNNSWALTQQGTSLEFSIRTTSGVGTATTPAVLTEDTWMHLTATYDGQYLRIYVDGVEQASVAHTGFIDYDDNGDGTIDELDNGYLKLSGASNHRKVDELSIWSAARNVAEIAADAEFGPFGANPDYNQDIPGLVAYYKFDQNWLDETVENMGGIGLDAQLEGSYSNMTDIWVASEVPKSLNLPAGALASSPNNAEVGNYALEFSTAYGHVEIPNASGFDNLTTDFTFEFWAKSSDVGSGSHSIIAKGSAFQLVLIDNEQLGLAIGNQEILIGSYFINDGTWYQYVLTGANGNELKLYRNGQFITERQSNFGISNTDNPLLLGYNFAESLIILDEVGIWSVAQTAEDIQEDFLSMEVPTSDNLIAFYNFDVPENSDVLTDLSGNQHDGTIYHTEVTPMSDDQPEISTVSILWTEGVELTSNHLIPQAVTTSMGEHALEFAYGLSYVEVQDDNRLDEIANDFSIEFWAKLTDAEIESERPLLHKNNAWGIHLNNGRQLILTTGNNNCSFNEALVTDNGWHQYALVAEGGNSRKLYRDGLLIDENTNNYTIEASADNLFIGFNDGNTADIVIDELSIWKRTRSETEIAESHSTRIIPTEDEDLVAYYKFNDGPDSPTLTDHSGHYLTGTIHYDTHTVPESNDEYGGVIPEHDVPTASWVSGIIPSPTVASDDQEEDIELPIDDIITGGDSRYQLQKVADNSWRVVFKDQAAFEDVEELSVYKTEEISIIGQSVTVEKINKWYSGQHNWYSVGNESNLFQVTDWLELNLQTPTTYDAIYLLTKNNLVYSFEFDEEGEEDLPDIIDLTWVDASNTAYVAGNAEEESKIKIDRVATSNASLSNFIQFTWRNSLPITGYDIAIYDENMKKQFLYLAEEDEYSAYVDDLAGGQDIIVLEGDYGYQFELTEGANYTIFIRNDESGEFEMAELGTEFWEELSVVWIDVSDDFESTPGDDWEFNADLLFVEGSSYQLQRATDENWKIVFNDPNAFAEVEELSLYQAGQTSKWYAGQHNWLSEGAESNSFQMTDWLGSFLQTPTHQDNLYLFTKSNAVYAFEFEETRTEDVFNDGALNITININNELPDIINLKVVDIAETPYAAGNVEEESLIKIDRLSTGSASLSSTVQFNWRNSQPILGFDIAIYDESMNRQVLYFGGENKYREYADNGYGGQAINLLDWDHDYHINLIEGANYTIFLRNQADEYCMLSLDGTFWEGLSVIWIDPVNDFETAPQLAGYFEIGDYVLEFDEGKEVSLGSLTTGSNWTVEGWMKADSYEAFYPFINDRDFLFTFNEDKSEVAAIRAAEECPTMVHLQEEPNFREDFIELANDYNDFTATDLHNMTSTAIIWDQATWEADVTPEAEQAAADIIKFYHALVLDEHAFEAIYDEGNRDFLGEIYHYYSTYYGNYADDSHNNNLSTSIITSAFDKQYYDQRIDRNYYFSSESDFSSLVSLMQNHPSITSRIQNAVASNNTKAMAAFMVSLIEIAVEVETSDATPENKAAFEALLTREIVPISDNPNNDTYLEYLLFDIIGATDSEQAHERLLEGLIRGLKAVAEATLLDWILPEVIENYDLTRENSVLDTYLATAEVAETVENHFTALEAELRLATLEQAITDVGTVLTTLEQTLTNELVEADLAVTPSTPGNEASSAELDQINTLSLLQIEAFLKSNTEYITFNETEWTDNVIPATNQATENAVKLYEALVLEDDAFTEAYGTSREDYFEEVLPDFNFAPEVEYTDLPLRIIEEAQDKFNEPSYMRHLLNESFTNMFRFDIERGSSRKAITAFTVALIEITTEIDYTSNVSYYHKAAFQFFLQRDFDPAPFDEKSFFEYLITDVINEAGTDKECKERLNGLLTSIQAIAKVVELDWIKELHTNTEANLVFEGCSIFEGYDVLETSLAIPDMDPVSTAALIHIAPSLNNNSYIIFDNDSWADEVIPAASEAAVDVVKLFDGLILDDETFSAAYNTIRSDYLQAILGSNYSASSYDIIDDCSDNTTIPLSLRNDISGMQWEINNLENDNKEAAIATFIFMLSQMAQDVETSEDLQHFPAYYNKQAFQKFFTRDYHSNDSRVETYLEHLVFEVIAATASDEERKAVLKGLMTSIQAVAKVALLEWVSLSSSGAVDNVFEDCYILEDYEVLESSSGLDLESVLTDLDQANVAIEAVMTDFDAAFTVIDEVIDAIDAPPADFDASLSSLEESTATKLTKVIEVIDALETNLELLTVEEENPPPATADNAIIAIATAIAEVKATNAATAAVNNMPAYQEILAGLQANLVTLQEYVPTIQAFIADHNSFSAEVVADIPTFSSELQVLAEETLDGYINDLYECYATTYADYGGIFLDIEGMQTNRWYHYALTYNDPTPPDPDSDESIDDDQVVILYINGAKIGDPITLGVPMELSADRLTLNYKDDQGISYLDDFSIWSYTKSTEEIENDFLYGVETGANGMLAYYDFNDGPGSATLSDISGSHKHGDLLEMDVMNDWHFNDRSPADYSPALDLTLIDPGAFDPGSQPAGDTPVAGDDSNPPGLDNEDNEVVYEEYIGIGGIVINVPVNPGAGSGASGSSSGSGNNSGGGNQSSGGSSGGSSDDLSYLDPAPYTMRLDDNGYPIIFYKERTDLFDISEVYMINKDNDAHKLHWFKGYLYETTDEGTTSLSCTTIPDELPLIESDDNFSVFIRTVDGTIYNLSDTNAAGFQLFKEVDPNNAAEFSQVPEELWD